MNIVLLVHALLSGVPEVAALFNAIAPLLSGPAIPADVLANLKPLIDDAEVAIEAWRK
jgi:hypothetical protein